MLFRSFPFSIQSLFCALDGEVPGPAELDAYLERLKRIRAAGGRIREVQLHTLARKPAQASCSPVSAAFLDNLRGRIGAETGLAAQVYGTQD